MEAGKSSGHAACAAASSGHGAAEGAVIVAEGLTRKRTLEVDMPAMDTLESRISDLRTEQQAMKARKKEIGKALKNFERRKTRLRQRARQLTDQDLVAVLMMRRDHRASRAQGSQAKPDADSAAAAAAAQEAIP